jgi:hypothetical protein
VEKFFERDEYVFELILPPRRRAETIAFDRANEEAAQGAREA